jgi:hypothetical protein
MIKNFIRTSPMCQEQVSKCVRFERLETAHIIKRFLGDPLLVSSLRMAPLEKHFGVDHPGQGLQAFNDPGSGAIDQI